MTDEAPALSVVVPVFNQAEAIVGNLNLIRERISAEFERPFEIIVVSDGSIDATEDELVASAPSGAFRVFHYDRNLGKGYAVKVGALEARGQWIAFVDADLDLDPAALASYVHRAEAAGLDFAIGSKRHPDSVVEYPRSRVAASWLFQQLVRLLFRLNVRDTQVGMKVFRREVADQVLPLLMVKRYAFDIELLAVARAFGFGRIEEMPVTLAYRFTGSGVRSRAVLRALVDTMAIFYRLRILRYYQRRRLFAGAYGWSRPRAYLPRVSVLAPTGVSYRDLSYPAVETLDVGDGSLDRIRAGAGLASGEVLAILEPDMGAPANLLSATVPYFVRDEIAAVVFPKMAPLHGPARLRAASAIDESRIGAGLGYFRFTPGNIRYVRDFPALSLLVRREDFLSLAPDVELPEITAHLASAGRLVLYTPDAVAVGPPAPLFRGHLKDVYARGRNRGRVVGARRIGLVRAVALIATPVLAVVVLLAAVVWSGTIDQVAALLLLVYGGAILLAASVAALRHQSLRVGVLFIAGVVPTHFAYAAGLVRGLVE